MRARGLATLAIAGLLGGAGCGKKAATPGGGGPGAPGPAAAAPQHVDGTPHTDAAVRAWQGAGLNPEGFAPITPVPFGAVTCEQGRVQTVDALVCEYRDQDALAKGQAGLMDQWGREGGHTGVAYHSKLTMIAVVDRARHDPNGKIIHQVIETFRKL
jgi:hypothetical protein